MRGIQIDIKWISLPLAFGVEAAAAAAAELELVPGKTGSFVKFSEISLADSSAKFAVGDMYNECADFNTGDDREPNTAAILLEVITGREGGWRYTLLEYTGDELTEVAIDDLEQREREKTNTLAIIKKYIQGFLFSFLQI